jgi:ATP-dependent HslUV protease ATP-binding subunit HslU
MQVFSGQGIEEVGLDMPAGLPGLFGSRRVQRKVPVREARRILAQQEAEKRIDRDRCIREGMERAQQMGIIFIDEIDKIVSAGRGSGPDVSREGVQRDLLPIVEGTTVLTRYGPVRTRHILFIAAGAFSKSAPSDLIPELQGRFPLRAELAPLGREELARILREPEHALLKQAQWLLETEGVRVEFTDDAVAEMARIAAEANATIEDIGARRLHAVVERVLEEISFEAPKIAPTRIVIHGAYVRDRMAGVWSNEDARRYIL